MIGWLLASFFFCLAGMGWWTAERYRQIAIEQAEKARQLQVLADTAITALLNAEMSKRLVDNFEREMRRHERTVKAEVRH